MIYVQTSERLNRVPACSKSSWQLGGQPSGSGSFSKDGERFVTTVYSMGRQESQVIVSGAHGIVLFISCRLTRDGSRSYI